MASRKTTAQIAPDAPQAATLAGTDAKRLTPETAASGPHVTICPPRYARGFGRAADLGLPGGRYVDGRRRSPPSQ